MSGDGGFGRRQSRFQDLYTKIIIFRLDGLHGLHGRPRRPSVKGRICDLPTSLAVRYSSGVITAALARPLPSSFETGWVVCTSTSCAPAGQCLKRVTLRVTLVNVRVPTFLETQREPNNSVHTLAGLCNSSRETHICNRRYEGWELAAYQSPTSYY